MTSVAKDDLQDENERLRQRIAELETDLLCGYGRVVSRRKAGKDVNDEDLSNERFWADVVRRASVGVSVGFPDGRLAMCNQAFQEITGYDQIELKTVDWMKVLTPQKWREFESEKLEELHATGRPVRYEKEYIRKDGSTIPIELNVHPQFDSEGDIFCYFAFVSDITERKRAEEILQLNLVSLRQGERIAKLGYFERNWQTGRAYWSAGFFQLLGYEGRLEASTHEDFVKHIHEDDLQRVKEHIQYTIKNRQTMDVEFALVQKNGQVIEIHGIAQNFYDEAGRPLTTRGTFQDITARKRADLKIHQLNADLERRVCERTAQLESSNKELESFAYSISHDLRSPLRSIDGFANALVESCDARLEETEKNYLERISGAAQRMDRLIDELLQLSRLSRVDMASVEVDLSAMALELVEELCSTDAQRKLALTVAPGMVAMGDPTLLHSVLLNLLSNALKFTSAKKKPVIEVGMATISGEETFFVRDNGAGFDMGFSEKLFGVFQRLHGADEFPGTGVGLAMVQRSIHRHGGRVWATGAVDEGATFYFTVASAK